MRKVTVIGGSGFVGSNLCSHLNSIKVPFEILDLKISKLFPHKTSIVDIRNSSSLKNKISGDIVVHLAAVHRDDVYDQAEYFKTNVEGTKNIIIECEKRNIKKLIFTSSVAVYGFAQPDTDERGEIKPFNEYGRTKYLAEEVLRNWYKKKTYKTSLTILRPTVIFGEGNRGNVYNLINQIASRKFLMIGDGNNKKSLSYIGNFVPFLVNCINQKDSYALFNYVDKPDLNMNTFTLLVKKELDIGTSVGFRVPFIFGILIGYFFDLYSKLLRRKTLISSVRIKKFCSSTSFSTNKESAIQFNRPYSLEQAIRITIEREFIKPDPNREIFFTE